MENEFKARSGDWVNLPYAKDAPPLRVNLSVRADGVLSADELRLLAAYTARKFALAMRLILQQVWDVDEESEAACARDDETRQLLVSRRAEIEAAPHIVIWGNFKLDGLAVSPTLYSHSRAQDMVDAVYAQWSVFKALAEIAGQTQPAAESPAPDAPALPPQQPTPPPTITPPPDGASVPFNYKNRYLDGTLVHVEVAKVALTVHNKAMSYQFYPVLGNQRVGQYPEAALTVYADNEHVPPDFLTALNALGLSLTPPIDTEREGRWRYVGKIYNGQGKDGQPRAFVNPVSFSAQAVTA